MDELIRIGVSLLAAFLALFTSTTFNLLTEHLFSKKTKRQSYSTKLNILTNELKKNANELDKLLDEISIISKDRENRIKQLEINLKELEISEKEYEDRISALQDVPIEAIDHLLKQLEPSERRNARRDYLLFIGGIFFGALVSILLSIFGIT